LILNASPIYFHLNRVENENNAGSSETQFKSSKNSRGSYVDYKYNFCQNIRILSRDPRDLVPLIPKVFIKYFQFISWRGWTMTWLDASHMQGHHCGEW
jgi:hypothetical protein